MSFRPRESQSLVVGPWGRCLLLVGAVGERLVVVGAVGEEDVGGVGAYRAEEEGKGGGRPGLFLNHFDCEKIANKQLFCLNRTQGAREEEGGRRP